MSKFAIVEVSFKKAKKQAPHILYNGVMCVNTVEMTSAVTALANAIACKLSVSEMTLLAGIFVQLGDTLATIAAGKALCAERNEETKSR